MASILDPLLSGTSVTDGELGTTAKEFDATNDTKPASYRKCGFTIAWLLLTGLGFLSLAHMYSPLMMTKPSGTLLVQGWGDASCYTFTGGTCMVSDCDPQRHATCGPHHNCLCTSGCVGADGNCHNISSYRLIGKNVRFRNVKYSDQCLYAPRLLQQLRTGVLADQNADLWNVYKMPGHDFLNHQEMYLFSPVEFPEYAAGVVDNQLSAYFPKIRNGEGVVVPIGNMFKVSLYHLTSRRLLMNRFPFDIGYFMNALCRPRSHPEAVEIKGALGQASWYKGKALSMVFGWTKGDPAGAGYWVPEPPLDIPLQFC